MYCSATGCGDECGATAKHLRNGIFDGWLTQGADLPSETCTYSFSSSRTHHFASWMVALTSPIRTSVFAALWIFFQLIWILMHLMCIGLWIFLMISVRDGFDDVTGNNDFDNDHASKKEQDKRGFTQVESNRSHSLSTPQKVLLVCACVCVLVVLIMYVIAFVWCDQWMPSLLWWSFRVGAAHSQWHVETLFNQYKVQSVLRPPPKFAHTSLVLEV